MTSAKLMVKKLNKIKEQLAKNRDELRDLQDEVETQLADKDDEIYGLDAVIDSLSKYV